jgi:hypothetical protein
MLDTGFAPKIEEENFIDEAILGALEECPFSSLRQIAKRMLIRMSTVQYHLVNSLGYRIRNIRRILHSLVEPKTSVCGDESRYFVNSPVSQAPRLEMHCGTGQSLVLFFKSFDRIWLPYDELRPSFPKQTIASQTLMITVVWIPMDFT